MTTWQSIVLVAQYAKARWRQATRPEVALVLVLEFLALVCFGAAPFGVGWLSITVVLIWGAVLQGAAFLAFLVALMRLGDLDMTARYLEQYGGEHLLHRQEGRPLRFDFDHGWIEDTRTDG